MKLPTITVKNPNGKGNMVINERDLDPKVHTIVTNTGNERVRKAKAKD